MKTVIAYVTCANAKEAEKIARTLVREGLIACANIIPKAMSIYRWKGKIVREKETLLIAKTREKLISKVIKRVKELHSYRVPAIECWNVNQANPEYTQWVMSETSAKKGRTGGKLQLII